MADVTVTTLNIFNRAGEWSLRAPLLLDQFERLAPDVMLRLSFKLEAEADAVEAAVRRTLGAGLRTPDIAGAGGTLVSTQEMGAAIERAL
ncbi:MAG: isocitrate/isopropylmalate family dehydrogenase [Dehalococcoidia bacterium]